MALSFVSLGLVCVLAYVVLKWLNRRGIGHGGGGPMRILGRCPLEPRRSLYVVEVAGRCFMVGVGDGPMALLAELDAEKVIAGQSLVPSGRGAAFGETLSRILGRGFRPGTKE